MPTKSDRWEIRTIKRGIITTAFLAIVYNGDEVHGQRVFPVIIGSGESKHILMQARNWCYKQASDLHKREREIADYERRMLIEKQKREITRQRKIDNARKMAATVHVDILAVRNRYGWGIGSMWTGYDNVYGKRVTWS